MRTSALTRVRRRNGRALLAAALTLVGEGVRTGVKRGNGKRNRGQLRRALCAIAERLALSDAELEPLIAEVRCGHNRGRWTREFTPTRIPLKPDAVALADSKGRRLHARAAKEEQR